MEPEFAEITNGTFICLCGHEQPDPRTAENEAGESFWFWLCPECGNGYLLTKDYQQPELADCFTVWPAEDDWQVRNGAS